jgi:hypothetical protein
MIQHDVGHIFGFQARSCKQTQKTKECVRSPTFSTNAACTQFRLLSLFFITKKQFLLCKVQTLFRDLFVVVLVCFGQEAKHAGKLRDEYRHGLKT